MDEKNKDLSSVLDDEQCEKLSCRETAETSDLDSRTRSEQGEEDKESPTKTGRNITRPPKKWSYQDGEGDNDTACNETGHPYIHNLGDLLWCRQANVCFYPALIVNDPHFKFHTKIVQAETGSPSKSTEAKFRQYHVQFLSDNKLGWVVEKFCLPFQGMTSYEQMAVEDVSNIKIYKPKPEKLLAWKEALVVADELQKLDKLDRVKRMETSRLKDGKSFIDKLETDTKTTQDSISVPLAKVLQRSPKKIRDSVDIEKDQRKSHQYNRKDEMQYKMLRHANRSNDVKTKVEETKTPPSFSPPVFNTNVTFSKSFKIKRDKKDITGVSENDCPEITSPVIEDNPVLESTESLEQEEKSDDAKEENGKEDMMDLVMCNQKLEQLVLMDGFGEGALVWAKMRGYPYWPSVVTRDPSDGTFVKVADTIYKNSRRLHVLFLEYGNQRAWIGSSSVKKFKGIELFNKEKEKASKKTRPDFTPNKRIRSSFDKAVKYAEELRIFSDEERLERVFLKYGWGLVEDDQSPTESLDRIRNDENETNKRLSNAMNSEADLDTAERVRTSESRRGSGEAESRIDPGTDEPEPSGNSTLPRPKFQPSKRPLREAALNGDSSDSESDSGNEQPAQKKVKVNSASRRKTSMKQRTEKTSKNTNSSKSTPALSISKKTMSDSSKTSSGSNDKEEFPRVGDLVWGRMPGFPYWPSFVTRSPHNIYRKENANGKSQYHVQFFGWNDESGWVTSVIEFEGLEAFQAIAVKKKSDKSFSPGKGASLKKWERAAREAEDTMGLTRQERVDQYLVSYAHKLEPASGLTPKRKNEETNQKSSSGQKTPKSTVSPKKIALPQGWIMENRVKEGKEIVVYISPDGVEFPSRAAMQRYVASERKSAGVVYVNDESLPTGWRCQKVDSTIFFFSPVGERFDSRRKVAEQMKLDNYNEEAIKKVLSVDKSRKPAPKSVLKRRGEYLTDESSQESDDEGNEMLKTLPKGYKYRFGGPYDKYLDIERLFDPSNGGLIDMVQLPDIFLEHPTVRVQESDNEMIISDVDSGEFIAKKIIYD